MCHGIHIFHLKIIYSDEMRMNGDMINQNVRICGDTNSLGIQCISKKSQFGIDFSLAVQAIHITLRTTLARPSLALFARSAHQRHVISTGQHHKP